MNNESTQIVEINGVKMEVDMRHAKVVHDNIKVGSAVKLMVKSSYGEPEVHTGVVIGFLPFDDLPTIQVAYLSSTYASADLKFANINSKSGDKFSLVPCYDDELPVNRVDMLAKFDRQIVAKQAEIQEIRDKKAYFQEHFDQFFADSVAEIDV